MISTGFFLKGRLIELTSGSDRKKRTDNQVEENTFNDPVPPTNPIETALLPVWKAVLGLDRIGITDNFFKLGGSQAELTELDTRLKSLFGFGLPENFDQSPTIRELALFLQNRSGSSQDPDPQESIRLENRKRRGRLKEREFFITPEYALTRWFVQNRSLQDVLAWVAGLARRNWFKHIFGFARAEFSRWYKLTGSEVPFEAAFEGYLQNQLVNYLPFDHNFQREPLSDLFARTVSTSTMFQRTMTQSLIDTPIRGDNPFFLFKNLHFFTEALDAGKGVILVTFHGNVRFPAFQDLEWISGSGLIDIISFTHGHLGKYTQAGELDQTSFYTSNAGVALDARKRLEQGKAILILSDTKDQRSKNYMVNLLGKQYSFKAGFAELSLLTKAPIIPVYKYLLEDGRIMTEFISPLTSHKTEYDEMVSDLLGQYVAFIAQAWRDHPEAMRRKLVCEHLNK